MIVVLEDLEQAKSYAEMIHDYLMDTRDNYNATHWQTFKGEPPYLLEVPDDIPNELIIDALT